MRTETNSSTALREQIEALRHMTVGRLKKEYSEVFGESSRSNHKQFLFRRIAWRIQANAFGGFQYTVTGVTQIGPPKKHSLFNRVLRDAAYGPLFVAASPALLIIWLQCRHKDSCAP